jgi:hypothetical protein
MINKLLYINFIYNKINLKDILVGFGADFPDFPTKII